jgi:hypothetical protein
MKILFILIPLFLFQSCSQESNEEGGERKAKKLVKLEKPIAPCEFVSWYSKPVIIKGYSEKVIELAIVETYIKNSNFDSVIKRYVIKIGSKVSDTDNLEKSFNLPKEVNSSFDFKIIFNNSQVLKITNVKTNWILRYFNGSAKGFLCEIVSFDLNGQPSEGNILLKKPPLETHYY